PDHLPAHKLGITDRRRELQHLETRTGTARRKLLDQQDEALCPERAAAGGAATAPPAFPPAGRPPGASPAAGPADLEQREADLERRGEVLARVAGELADQRLHLAEQAERLLLTHQ